MKVIGFRPLPLSKIQEPLIKLRSNLELDENFVQSVRENLIQEITVRRVKLAHLRTYRYRIVCGFRRFTALQGSDKEKIICKIIECEDEEEQAMQFQENTQRLEVNTMDQAEYVEWVCEKDKITHEEAAKRFHLDKSRLSHILQVYKEPVLRDMVKTRTLSQDTAEYLHSLLSRIDDSVNGLDVNFRMNREKWEELVWACQGKSVRQAKQEHDKMFKKLDTQVCDGCGDVMTRTDGSFRFVCPNCQKELEERRKIDRLQKAAAASKV